MHNKKTKFHKGRYVYNKTTIAEHLSRIDQNGTVTEYEIRKLVPKVRDFFIACDLVKCSRDFRLMKYFIKLIFETQGNRCGLWLQTREGEINSVWNNPGNEYNHWHSNWISYEVDHVEPVNAGGGECLTNAQFLSPNANRFIKCSLTNDQLLRRIDLSDRLKDRIREVQKKRQELFNSQTWHDFIDLVDEIENTK